MTGSQIASDNATLSLPYPEPADVATSERMKAVRRSDTGFELALRSALHRMGFRFRKDFRIRAGGKLRSVDIVFPSDGLAVFANGCFWHLCPDHGVVPKTNPDYWGPKLRRNAERDELIDGALRRDGWSVLRVWDHSTPQEAADQVATRLHQLRDRASRRRSAGRTCAIDLFAGAGGSTQGLKDAGYEILAAIELDAIAADSYAANHSEVELLRQDICEVKPRTLRRRLGLDKGELGLLNACPPCQGFSTLGRGDAEDKRNDLVMRVESFLAEFMPATFIIENVPGLRRDRRLARLLKVARDLGYGVKDYVINATDFGVPQSRRRLIVLGVRSGAEEIFPDHPATLLPRDFRRDFSPLLEVLEGAGDMGKAKDPIHKARKSTAAVKKRISAIPINGNRFDLPEAEQLACHKSMGSRRSATASYGRMRLDAPAPTLTTRCTTPACGRFVHPIEHRGISLREAALIQTFPRKYAFTGTYQQIEAQIGNAVPARLAMALGLAAAELLLDTGND
jgi:DNA (cytosine-5)-methyltransferase 1